jgi:hypothetical protein
MTNNWYNFYKLSFRNKLDLFSKKIAQDIFDNFLKNKDRGRFQYIISSDQEKELLDYDIKEIIFVADFYATVFRVIGHYLPDQSAIVINIEINPQMLLKNYQNPTKSEILSKNYEKLIQEIKYTIRHELEHANYNELYNYSEPNYEIPSKFNNYFQYVLLTKQYLLDPSEIDSFIRELMLKAKNKRIIIDNLLVKMVNKKVTEIAPDIIKKEIENKTSDGIIYKNIIDEILRTYRQRIDLIYKTKR